MKYQEYNARRNLSPANMADEYSGMPAPKGFPSSTPISIQPPCIRDFQLQFIGDSATSKLHHNIQPLTSSPVAPPGHIPPPSGLPAMQRPLSPTRLSCQPLLDCLGQPPTQLVPEMHDEITLSQTTCSPASHSAPFGIAISHSQQSRVLHAVPPPERKPLDAAAEFQMQVDTNAPEPTHQDAMELDGGSPLPWRNPFDESDEAHSTIISKFRLADVFVQTAKVTEEWSKVERPQIPLPKRRRLPQVNSPTTRAGTKAPLHKLNPQVVGIPSGKYDSDRKSSPSRKVDGAPVTSIAAIPVLEAPPQPPALEERFGRRSLEIERRLRRLQELARHGEQEKGQVMDNLTPIAAVPSCGSSPLKLEDTRAVSSMQFNPLGGPSTRQHGQLTFLAPAKPPTMDNSRQSIAQSAKGQLSAPEKPCQPAATAAAQSTGPAVCLTPFSPSNSGPPITPCNRSGAPAVMEMRTPKDSRRSLMAATPLPPPAPPQQVKTEPTAIKPEPSSPKIHPLVQLITIAEVAEALRKTRRRSPGFASPATPLPSQDIPLPSPPTVALPSFNVEAMSPPATAPQPNTMTKSRSAALGSTIPQPAIPPQLGSTTMDVQMTQPEQGPFIPRTPPKQPNHTGPMYYSPAAPPPVSHSRRSASPPPPGQSVIRARTASRHGTPQRLSPGWRTPTHPHPPSRSHLPRHDIGARIYTDDHMQTDDRPRRERIDLQMNSYDPHYADDRPLSGFESESYHLSHESEPGDRTFSSSSRDRLRNRHRPKSMETGSVPPAQHLRNPQSECRTYREPNESEWSHPNRRDLGASKMGHQADSSRHPANVNTSPLERSTCTSLDASLSSYPRAGSGPLSAGSPSYPRDVNWGSRPSETLQVDPRVSSIGPLVQTEARVPAPKRPREPESSPSLEETFHSTKSTSITEPAPKRQRIDTTSSERQTGGNSQTLVGMTSYHLEEITTLSLQETPIGYTMMPSTSQPTLADRMGMLNKSSNVRQSPPGSSRGPLMSRFSSGLALRSVSQPALEASDEVSPPTGTRPLLDRFTTHEESLNQARAHRGARSRGRGGGRGLGIPPSEPSFSRHQPLGQRLSGGTHVKNNSLLERME